MQSFTLVLRVAGLPKAAVVSQSKAVKGSVLFQTLGISEDDVFYTALPLYHSAAGIMALGTTVVIGKHIF
jgi:acyl-CoA synthetase (AMP-forming)/AMP-acid ligase II